MAALVFIWCALMSDTRTKKLCLVNGCGKEHHAKGLCQAHYSKIHKKSFENQKRTNTKYRKTLKGKYKEYEISARKRKHEFSLTFDVFSSFAGGECFWCGDKINIIGIDRLDNKIGYVPTNCVRCCQMCNIMKSYLSAQQFIDQCMKITKLHQVIQVDLDTTSNISTKHNSLELLSCIDRDLAEFCRNSSITDDEEVEEIWKMFRARKILN